MSAVGDGVGAGTITKGARTVEVAVAVGGDCTRPMAACNRSHARSTTSPTPGQTESPPSAVAAFVANRSNTVTPPIPAAARRQPGRMRDWPAKGLRRRRGMTVAQSDARVGWARAA